MSRERRERKRIGFSVNARINVDSNWYDCSCSNISMSGMLIHCKQKFKKGSTGQIYIMQQSGSTKLNIKANCEFTRDSVEDQENDNFEVGLKFLRLLEDSSLNLYQIFRHYDAI